MAGDLFPVAGMKLFIGGVKALQAADFVEADFSGETWVEIDGWSQMGSVGDTAALITTSLINRGRDIKQKGTTNAGSMENVFAVIPGDPGQEALIAAAAGANKQNYAFKIEHNDDPGGTGSAPSMSYFVGLAMNSNESGGEANTIRNLNATIEINSNIVNVDAVPGTP